jgi:hypothetical protein
MLMGKTCPQNNIYLPGTLGRRSRGRRALRPPIGAGSQALFKVAIQSSRNLGCFLYLIFFHFMWIGREKRSFYFWLDRCGVSASLLGGEQVFGGCSVGDDPCAEDKTWISRSFGDEFLSCVIDYLRQL